MENEQPIVTFRIISVSPNISVGPIMIGPVFTDKDAALAWLNCQLVNRHPVPAIFQDAFKDGELEQ